MNGKKTFLCCSLLITLISFAVTAQPGKQQWVDSVFQTLNENDKIGQLFFLRFSSHIDEDILRGIVKKAESGDLGGIVFTTGTVAGQARVTNMLQAETRIPLLIAQDGASGLGHLIDGALTYPVPVAQAAIANDSMMYWLARDIGRQMKALGVHLSLSPDATPLHSETSDADRTYGDNPAAVRRKALMHMKGLQAAGILSCAKFFPLKSIAVVDQKGKSQITLYHDTIVSAPYRDLFANGLNAIMPNAADLHLFFEQKRSDLKKKLSEESFKQFESGDLLHKPLDYDGIVMIDLHSVEHSSDHLTPGDGGLFAFQAGADIIISDEDPDAALRKIRKLVHTEKKYAARLNERVRKVLAMKYDAALFSREKVDSQTLQKELYDIRSQVLRRKSFRESVTVVRNEHKALPISILDDKKFVVVIAGDSSQRADIFHRSVKKYIPADRIIVGEAIVNPDLSGKDVILVAVFPGTTVKAMHNLLGLLQEYSAEQEIIISDFGCKIFEPYAAGFSTLIMGYSDEKDVVGLLPQIIFGAISGKGKLPQPYAGVPSGSSIETTDLNRLAYSFPEDAGVDAATLERISQIAGEAISSGSTPGCYVLVARNGKVIYDKAFGHLTYEQKSPVTDDTIYDLASLTKVSATLQAVMFMQEHGLIDIHKKLSVYLPELRGTNKKDITIVDALIHQSGLLPFVPLWPLTLEGPALKPIYYSSQQNVSYPLQVAPTLFGSPVLRDSVWSWITYSQMLEKPQRTPYPYRYSDLGFMMFKQLAERTINQPLEDFLQQNFYEPLGAHSLGYTPLGRFPADIIAPTELDTLFRGGLLIGTVHDERAAMLGGVSGHAGLFGTANDLSKLGQMLLQEGSYGGLQYYKPETVKLFTTKHFDSSRRGLGWDKPVQGEWNSPTSRYASPATFGHTGFTGTCLWIDPEFDLVYIFLSNRVFPARSDKLIQTNIRSRIQDVIYEAIFNYCKTYETGDF